MTELKSAHSVLIGGWESPAYWQILVAAKIRHLRTVGFYESTLHSSRFSKGPIAKARALFFKSLDAVVVPGSAAREAVLSMGVEGQRIFMGFNAIDVKQFDIVARATRTEIGVENTGHKFVYVGQLIKRKNVDGLLSAFHAIRDAGDSLTIIGSGEHRKGLEALVMSLGLTDVVRFLEPIDNAELASVLATAHTLVMPSHEEVWGLVANEALACGLHVVVTLQSGVASSIDGMRGVEIAPNSSPSSIQSAMARSRSHWTGWVDAPAILDFTPDVYAKTFVDALRVDAV